MCDRSISIQKSGSRQHRAWEGSVFARSGSEFECLRGSRSPDTLLGEAIQSFTSRLLADDWCHDVRHSLTLHPGKRNSADAEGNSTNF
jgi:hypothetical protein